MTNTFKQILVYFFIPVLAALAMLMVYFSNLQIAREIIAPAYNREFGLLENLQNIFILGISVVSLIAFFKHRVPLLKAIFLLSAILSAIVFFEEIDYGLHYYEYLNNIPPSKQADIRNLHNIGNRTHFIKLIVQILMILWFVIAPFVLTNTKNALLKYILPSKYSVLTLLSALVITRLALWMGQNDFPSNLSLSYNLSEFTEVFFYFLFFLYFYELAFNRSMTRT